uniref:Uncharacterized protein n=1 Tax=Anguilla anguilla TaxID=7936 RepID=A0A0E9XTL4_ANGAN
MDLAQVCCCQATVPHSDWMAQFVGQHNGLLLLLWYSCQ